MPRRDVEAETGRRLEANSGAQPHGASVLNLLDGSEVAGAVLAVAVAGRGGISLPLQDRVRVQRVEEIGGQGDVGLLEEGDDLLKPQIELVHVLQTEVRRVADEHGASALAVARVDLDERRVQIPLPAVEIAGHVEAHRQLIQGADVEAPVRVDPDVAEVAAAERLVVE